eukprot:2155063-Prymnesium_polylepis.1
MACACTSHVRPKHRLFARVGRDLAAGDHPNVVHVMRKCILERMHGLERAIDENLELARLV